MVFDRKAWSREYYRRNKSDPDKYRKYLEYQKDYRTRETSQNRRRALQLFRDYGLTTEQYEQMVVLQDGKCAICGCVPEESLPPLHNALYVDHNHKTGKVRELLCTNCNLLLGRLNDDPELLRRAAEYLEKHRGV